MTTRSWTRSNPFDEILGHYQVRNILEHARGDSLLDLGCNDGRLLRCICGGKEFVKAVGVDSDADKVDTAKKSARVILETRSLVHFSHVCSTIEDFETKDKFGTITMINVLEHVSHPIGVLKKAGSWLEDKGVLIIHVPNALGLNRRLGVKMGLLKDEYELGEQDFEVGHNRFYDQYTLKEHINRAGLECLQMGGVLLKPFSNKQMQRMADEWEETNRVFDGLYELAREMPECSSPIWAVCRKGNGR